MKTELNNFCCLQQYLVIVNKQIVAIEEFNSVNNENIYFWSKIKIKIF